MAYVALIAGFFSVIREALVIYILWKVAVLLWNADGLIDLLATLA